MAITTRVIGAAGAVLATALAFAAPATAEERSFTWSANIGAVSDYMFRGFSQRDDKPALQGGIDIGYGIWYAGVWGSHTGEGFNAAPFEIDLYTGIKPVLGPVTFDFGVLYYGYPSQDAAISGGLDVDYWEFKAGASMSPIKDWTVGVNYFYSPDYSFEVGVSHTVEGTLAYAFPNAIGPFTPTISGTLGYMTVENNYFTETDGTPGDDILYWNAGVALAVEKITFDLRYYGSNKDVDVPGSTSTTDRFVFGAKLALP